MDFLSKHNDFLNESRKEAHHKNDPIKELYDEPKLAIFMVGAPASGKSEIIKGVILRKTNRFRIIDPDDKNKILTRHLDKMKSKFVSRIAYTKYYNTIHKRTEEHPRITGLTQDLVKQFEVTLMSGTPLIYDSTGNNKQLIDYMGKKAKDNGYKVIFMHVLSRGMSWSMEQAQKRADLTGRPVDEKYLSRLHKGTQKLISYYGDQSHIDNYYVLLNAGDANRPKYYKYKNGELHKRKAGMWRGVTSKQLVESTSIPSPDDVLHVFDMDDTLIDSPSFPETYEFGLPDEDSDAGKLIDYQLRSVGATRNDVEIMHHRITVPKELAPQWTDMFGRAIMPKPNEWYLTDDSLGRDVNPEIKSLYDDAHNKAILTGRHEKVRDKVIDNFINIGLELPNKGFYLSPISDGLGHWKAGILKQLCEQYNEVHYYEDKLSWIHEIRDMITNQKLKLYHVSEGRIIGQY